MVRCEESGELILPGESEVCSVTGCKARRGALGASAVSGKWALRSELLRCDFTGADLLPVEAGTSDISGKQYRLDQAMTSAISKRVGHTSEFVAAVAPSGWIARDEAAQSAVSGEWGAIDSLKPSDRPPHRLGLVHELCRCSVSGRTLLRDEVAPSAASGKIADRDLLLPSACSGKLAVPEEMVICDVTGMRLLPDEVVRCAATGKTVDLRETVESGISGRRALRGQLIRCTETGRMLLPDESATCEASGARVVPEALGKCAVSGRRAVQRSMPRCPSTDRQFIDDLESRRISYESTGKFAVLQQCAWTGEAILGVMLGTCSITGIKVKPELLNKQSEFSALRTMLDGRPQTGSRSLEISELHRVLTLLRESRSCNSVLALDAPVRGLSLLVLRMRVGFLGFGSSFVAVAADLGAVTQLISSPVEGRREGDIWVRR